MSRATGIGLQDFEAIRQRNVFYVDKSDFIRQWWESEDDVTLITRPRRFGKTLTMSMTEKFFSVRCAGRGDLFQGLSIWQREKFKHIQGTYPVISFSFANVKEKDYKTTIQRINQIITDLYNDNIFLLKEDMLSEEEKNYFQSVSVDMPEVMATMAIHRLSKFLHSYYGKKVIILLDEYDTPMQEAYVNGYWDELVSFTRSMFHASFKTNPYMERAIMTGITSVSRESVFSDLNHLEIVTTTSEKYEDCFGFTEEEVFSALDEFGLSNRKQEVKKWYDGFTFGDKKDIYNPWSIINYLDKKKARTYWANSSSNSLVSKLIQKGSREVKLSMEKLLLGESLTVKIDEQIVYNQLDTNEEAIWSLLLASGYLRIIHYNGYPEDMGEYDILTHPKYELALTNLEVRLMFGTMIRGWFQTERSDYNDFIKALLNDDVKAMNIYMNRVALATFSYFDTGKGPFGDEPERFYHGFVLGLIVELADRCIITSNRESGFGRYDVMLEPRNHEDCGIIIEFKVQNIEEEKELSNTVNEALKQIERQKYETVLTAKGISKDKIRKYGFAFHGKQVLIGGNICGNF